MLHGPHMLHVSLCDAAATLREAHPVKRQLRSCLLTSVQAIAPRLPAGDVVSV